MIVSGSKIKLGLKIVLIVLLDAVTVLLNIQWLIFGIPIILIFYYFRNDPVKRFWLFSLCCIGSILISTLPSVVLLYEKEKMELVTRSIIASAADLCYLLIGYLFIALLYNGEKKKNTPFTKWFFYIFYPLHFLIIFFIKLLAGIANFVYSW